MKRSLNQLTRPVNMDSTPQISRHVDVFTIHLHDAEARASIHAHLSSAITLMTNDLPLETAMEVVMTRMLREPNSMRYVDVRVLASGCFGDCLTCMCQTIPISLNAVGPHSTVFR